MHPAPTSPVSDVDVPAVSKTKVDYHPKPARVASPEPRKAMSPTQGDRAANGKAAKLKSHDGKGAEGNEKAPANHRTMTSPASNSTEAGADAEQTAVSRPTSPDISKTMAAALRTTLRRVASVMADETRLKARPKAAPPWKPSKAEDKSTATAAVRGKCHLDTLVFFDFIMLSSYFDKQEPRERK